ncbi:glycosyltransferase family 39 protein [bacterium]|nr:glycosyltransferase family 39 protein [candidate division CSSED10-310 bacterium]
MKNGRENAGHAWLLPVSCLLLLFVIYTPSLDAFFVADDFHYLRAWTPGDMVRNFLFGRHKLFFRPLVDLLLAVQFRLFKTNQVGYHAVGLLLHAGNTWLLFGMLRRILQRDRAAVTALLFLVFSLHVRIVPWLSNQFELWATCFTWLALTFWLDAVAGRGGGGRRDAGWILGLAAAALLSKGTAISLPGIMAVVWTTVPRPRRSRRSLAILGATVFVVGLYLVYRMLVLGAVGVYGNATHLRFDVTIPLHLVDYLVTICASLVPLAAPWDRVLGALLLIGLSYAAFIRPRTAALLGAAIIALLPAANLTGWRFMYPAAGYLLAALVSVAPAGLFRMPWRRLGIAALTVLMVIQSVVVLRFAPRWFLAGRAVRDLPFQVREYDHLETSDVRLFFLDLPAERDGVHVFRKGIAVHGICMMVLSIPRMKSFGIEWSDLARIPSPPSGVTYHFFQWTPSHVTPRLDLDRLFRSYGSYLETHLATGMSWDFKRSSERAAWSFSPDLVETPGDVSWRHASVGGDPYLVCNGLAVDPRTISSVRLTMAIQDGGRGVQGRIYWTTDSDSNWDERKSLPFPLRSDAGLHAYEIPLIAASAWLDGGLLTGLRVDPTTIPGRLTIESIELLPPLPFGEFQTGIPLEFPTYLQQSL